MKTRTKILFSVVALILGIFFGGNKAEAGTYTVGNYTFTVTHCNVLGICHDPLYQEAKETLAYALAAHKSTYTKTLACGNTVTLVLKSCRVTNVCSGGNVISLNSKCKRTTTTCNCGCASGACNKCPGDPVDKPTGDEDTTDTTTDPSTCSEDIWQCGAWSSCTAGNQSRSCLMVFNCPNAVTPSPVESQSCSDNTLVPACSYPAADGSCPPPDISFSASPKLISKGGSCTLRWNVSGAEACTIDSVSVTPANGDGTKSVSPQTTTLYKMVCTNGPASASASQSCSVQDVSEQ